MTVLAWGVLVIALMAAGNFWQARRRVFDWRGRVVLITGGSRGLGFALARRCARAGARVVICGRTRQTLQRARERLKSAGLDVHTVVCDITRPEHAHRLVAHVRQEIGPIDVLINNAGIIQVGPLETMTWHDDETAMATHFWAPLRLIMSCRPSMQQQRFGRIVNIVSISGKMGVPHLAPYTASKFALGGFSQCLRAELITDQVYVTTVYPGLMRTDSPLHALFKGRFWDEYRWFSRSDSLPLLTISADAAARRILRACRYGDAESVLTAPAWFAAKLHGLWPTVTMWASALSNRLLPKPGGIGRRSAPGYEGHSRIPRSWLTKREERAAREYNELDDGLSDDEGDAPNGRH